ncbi:MAG: glycerophosphodiester phosphodiesterase family protein, partial [Phocaeicola sp.]
DDVFSGNLPGIYIEFKEPLLNPEHFEQIVYDELDRLGMNIITQRANENEPFYKDGKVNVGNTNGKVILQTFSKESLSRVATSFKGEIPTCFLLWKEDDPTGYDSPIGYAGYINFAIKNKAHIMGPSIAGAPNNYDELNHPWQNELIIKARLLNHPYSFDTDEQMNYYFGENRTESLKERFTPPYFNGLFTNRSDLTIKFLADKNLRDKKLFVNMPKPNELLDLLGY